MSSSPLRVQQLLHKYLADSCSKEELAELWSLLESQPSDEIIANEVRALWDKTDAAIPDAQKEHAFEKLRTHIQAQPARTATRYRYLKPLAVAASIICCVALAWWLLPGNKKDAVRSTTYAKTSIVHKVLHLPDGTTVTLSNDSKLDYPSVFDGKTREVTLSGEAYFDVKHDDAKPFIVHTGKYFTRVLGTAFNIKAYAGETGVAVTVTRGKVQVQRMDNNKLLGVLLPGDQLVVDNNEYVKVARVNVSEVLNWRRQDLLFDNITYGEAIALIGNYYSVSIRFKNEALASCRFTGNFTNNKLDETMDIIGALTRSKWHRESDSTITIEGEGCK